MDSDSTLGVQGFDHRHMGTQVSSDVYCHFFGNHCKLIEAYPAARIYSLRTPHSPKSSASGKSGASVPKMSVKAFKEVELSTLAASVFTLFGSPWKTFPWAPGVWNVTLGGMHWAFVCCIY